MDKVSPNDFNYEDYKYKREFYASSKEFDFVGYIQKGSKEVIDFVEYSGNNEKSCGIFNQDGLLDNASIKELRKKLRNTKSPIWHGIISFEEIFGKEKCGNHEQASELIKSIFPRFLRNAKFNADNITWFAALHTNTENRHIHFSFFENEPQRYRQRSTEPQFSHGKISLDVINKVKLDIELTLEKWHTKIAGIRKDITTDFRQITKNHKRGEVYRMFTKLLQQIPPDGRLQYDSQNLDPVRHEIDTITTYIIQGEQNLHKLIENFFTIVKEKDQAIMQMCQANKTNPTKFLLFDKYRQDLYRRLGNVVLNSVRAILFEQNRHKETKSRLAQKRIKRAKQQSAFAELVRLSKDMEREVKEMFEEFISKLDEVNYMRLIDEGVIQS